MSKLSPKALFIIALIISLIAAFLMYKQLNKVGQENLDNTREVILATVDIPAKTLITDKMLTTTRVPIEMVQKGAFVTPQEVLGKFSRTAIVKGEQVTSSRIGLTDRGSGLVAVLPSDKRAITVGVTDTTGLSGLAKAGDKVDIISVKTINNNVVGQILLQNVMIMAINRSELSDEPATPNAGKAEKQEKLATITLAVNPKDAVLLSLAQNQGSLQLILRPENPTEDFVNNTVIVEPGSSSTTTSGSNKADTNPYGVRVIKGTEVPNSTPRPTNNGESASSDQVKADLINQARSSKK